jgi:hypothetical protein
VTAITAARADPGYVVAMSTFLRRAGTIAAPLACVGFGLWLAYMGASWPLALAGTAAAGSLALLAARAWRDHVSR